MSSATHIPRAGIEHGTAMPIDSGSIEIRNDNAPLEFSGAFPIDAVEMRRSNDPDTYALISGVAVPYGLVDSEQTLFKSRAFVKNHLDSLAAKRPTIRNLFIEHDYRAGAVGSVVSMDPYSALGLQVECRIHNTDKGAEVIRRIESGELWGFSIGFEPLRVFLSKDQTYLEVREAMLVEVSLTSNPSAETLVEGIRYKPADRLARLERRYSLSAAPRVVR